MQKIPTTSSASSARNEITPSSSNAMTRVPTASGSQPGSSNSTRECRFSSAWNSKAMLNAVPYFEENVRSMVTHDPPGLRKVNPSGHLQSVSAAQTASPNNQAPAQTGTTQFQSFNSQFQESQTSGHLQAFDSSAQVFYPPNQTITVDQPHNQGHGTSKSQQTLDPSAKEFHSQTQSSNPSMTGQSIQNAYGGVHYQQSMLHTDERLHGQTPWNSTTFTSSEARETTDSSATYPWSSSSSSNSTGSQSRQHGGSVLASQCASQPPNNGNDLVCSQSAVHRSADQLPNPIHITRPTPNNHFAELAYSHSRVKDLDEDFYNRWLSGSNTGNHLTEPVPSQPLLQLTSRPEGNHVDLADHPSRVPTRETSRVSPNGQPKSRIPGAAQPSNNGNGFAPANPDKITDQESEGIEDFEMAYRPVNDS